MAQINSVQIASRLIFFPFQKVLKVFPNNLYEELLNCEQTGNSPTISHFLPTPQITASL
jgi:hypothetical protein